MDYAGENSFSLVVAVEKDRLPKDIPKNYIHHKKVQANNRTQTCQFLKSVIIEKEVQVTPTKLRKKLYIAM